VGAAVLSDGHSAAAFDAVTFVAVMFFARMFLKARMPGSQVRLCVVAASERCVMATDPFRPDIDQTQR